MNVIVLIIGAVFLSIFGVAMHDERLLFAAVVILLISLAEMWDK